MNISKLIDLSKYDPASKKLTAFINKKIKIVSFKPAKSLSKDKTGNPKPAIAIKFLDNNGNTHEYITAATLLVKQLYDIQAATGFGTNNSTISDGIDCYLKAEKTFGRYRNFYLSDSSSNSDESRDEDKIEEATVPTPNIMLNDNDIDEDDE